MTSTSANAAPLRPVLSTRPFTINLVRVGTDACWTVFLFATTYALFPLGIQNVERYFWAVADLAVVILLLPMWPQFLRAARREAIFLTWPVLACASVFWSLTPGITLYHGVQLLMTVLVALLLCIYASLERIVRFMFFALLAAAVLSVVYVQLRPGVAIYWAGEWLGVFPHKNVFGYMMLLLVLTSLCLWLAGWHRFLTAGATILGLLLVYKSKSGTAALVLAMALSIVPLACWHKKSWNASAGILGVVLIIASIALAIVQVFDVELVTAVLNALGKDATLTGRTVLWEYGIQAYQERPWLGYGFKGYWESFETSAPLLRLVIGQELWYFHNSFLEVAVAFGVLGPVLLIAGLWIAVYRCVRNFVLRPDFITLWPILFLYVVIVSCMVDHLLFVNHSLYQLLLIVAAAATPPRPVPRRNARH
jgi:O-antigen ligase